MRRSKAIATWRFVHQGSKQSRQNECAAQRRLRRKLNVGTATVPMGPKRQNECAAQRRLRPPSLKDSAGHLLRVRMNAPLKGDCDLGPMATTDASGVVSVRMNAPRKGDCDPLRPWQRYYRHRSRSEEHTSELQS